MPLWSPLRSWWHRLIGDQTGLPRWRRRIRVALMAISLLPWVGCAGCTVAMIRGCGHETLGEFPIGNGREVIITAEGSTHYEPPGYNYCKIRQGSQVVVPERRFLSVGSERVPKWPYSVVTFRGGSSVAIFLAQDLVFVYDFPSQQIWPGLYTRPEEGEEFARESWELLKRLNPKITCAALHNLDMERYSNSIRR